MSDFEKRDVARSAELYKMKCNQLSACITRLCHHLLGNDYMITAPVDEVTACEMITDEICERYRNVNDETNKALYEFIEEQLRKLKQV